MKKNLYIAPAALLCEVEADDILTFSTEEGAGDETEFPKDGE